MDQNWTFKYQFSKFYFRTFSFYLYNSLSSIGLLVYIGEIESLSWLLQTYEAGVPSFLRREISITWNLGREDSYIHAQRRHHVYRGLHFGPRR